MFDELVCIVFDGVFYGFFCFNGDVIFMIGYVESNNCVFNLMWNLDVLDLFELFNLLKV